MFVRKNARHGKTGGRGMINFIIYLYTLYLIFIRVQCIHDDDEFKIFLQRKKRYIFIEFAGHQITLVVFCIISPQTAYKVSDELCPAGLLRSNRVKEFTIILNVPCSSIVTVYMIATAWFTSCLSVP